MKVALDLLGGNRAPGPVVDGALVVAAASPDIEVVLVGPPDVAADHGSASPTAIAHCVYAAAQAVAVGLVPQNGDAPAAMVVARRHRAGLEVASP